MQKILVTGLAAALALGLTACDGTGTGDSAAAPPAPSGASTPAPSETSTSGGAASAPNASSPEAQGTPAAQEPSSETPGGRQIKSKWGQLRYLAPGKFTVGGVAFFTANATVLYVADDTCPDGSRPPGDSKCNMDGFEKWVQAAPRNAVVEFSGQSATLIRETQ
ncbi:hypothetical protein [Actinomadura sp. WAC 06369]|uniref:hypothetical protein n=1 Tax=Actinomadura sp. WAC 06369 TaxID=2203193 RepID=UPI000F770FC1|nr:hypothetical protein [Actinomadura sp. WAC 06369]RSN66657.1 hypothetical protein DMH08_15890 [Actinomadura sp. WAC 06369]